MTAYRNGDFGINQCARLYGVPKATLKRHLERKNKYSQGTKSFGRRPVFTEETENEMHYIILKLESMFFGLPRKELMTLAFQMAEERGVEHPFNKEKRAAGKKWYYGFLKRHSDICQRQPEATSLARARGFNEASINRYFGLLAQLIDSNGLTADNIFNVDESGISTVQKKCQRVLGKKVKKKKKKK